MKGPLPHRVILFAAGLSAVAALALAMFLAQQAAGNGTGSPDWANPKAMTVKRLSPMPGAQSEPNYLNNLDCTLITYRQAGSTDMQTGCFTETAFGFMETDSNLIIFNGTDEALPLIPVSPRQTIVPWPRAQNAVSLFPVDTGGSYLSLYRNFPAALRDQRNPLLQLTAKKLLYGPEIRLTDKTGRHLVVNPQTLTYSGYGSWLAVETLFGSFVRINLASLEVKPFAGAYGSQGLGLLPSRTAISSDGRYVAVSNQAAKEFKVYDLESCAPPATGTNLVMPPENCPAYNYRPFLENQIAGLQTIRRIRFINDRLLSVEAVTDNPATTAVYALAPAAGIDSLTGYIGLGDSFTSGEGAFNYRAGTDTDTNRCHLSLYSYPLLIARDIFSTNGGRSVACSGARINDIGSLSDSYRGQVKRAPGFGDLRQSQIALFGSIITNFVPGYLPQQYFIGRYQPAVITVSVGGNDMGFGHILKSCVTPRLTRNISDNTCYNNYEDRKEILGSIKRQQPRLVSLYKRLIRQAPQAGLYVIGYPQLAVDRGSCAVNVRLNRTELVFVQELTDYINGVIAQAAGEAGVVYVDISQALKGHRLCEAPSHAVAVNGLTAGTDGGLLGINMLGAESYHPNALGHQLMAQAILRQTNNLTKKTAIPAVAPDESKLLQVPKTGRPVVNRAFADMSPEVINRGNPFSLSVAGDEYGLKPLTNYTVRVDGPDGQSIGSAATDDAGDITTLIPLPEFVSPGSHTIDVSGEGQSDQPTVITQPVFVPVSPVDADDDALPDTADSCPLIVNSGQDVDKDGVDDVCDGLIGNPQDTDQSATNTARETEDQSNGTGRPSDPPANGSNTSSGTASTKLPTDPANSANDHKVLGATSAKPGATKQGSAPMPYGEWHLPSSALALASVILLLIISYYLRRQIRRGKYVIRA